MTKNATPRVVKTTADLEVLFRANDGHLGLKYDGGNFPLLNRRNRIVGYLGAEIAVDQFTDMRDKFAGGES